MSGRWMVNLVRGLARPRHVLSPGEAAGDMVIEDALQIRRSLNALADRHAPVALQDSDGEHFGAGFLRTHAVHGVQLVLQAGDQAPRDKVPTSLNATASGERGLLFFTLHGLTSGGAGRLLAPWPVTLIQVQSRRHARVNQRMEGLTMTLPGVHTRVRLRDLSEEGIGLMLNHSDWPAGVSEQPALLHLGDQTLPVPMLQWVHGGPGIWAGSGQPAGARLVGMAAEHVQQLRHWLAEGPAPQTDQG